MLQNVFSPPTAESKILRYGFTQENIHSVYMNYPSKGMI